MVKPNLERLQFSWCIDVYGLNPCRYVPGTRPLRPKKPAYSSGPKHAHCRRSIWGRPLT